MNFPSASPGMDSSTGGSASLLIYIRDQYGESPVTPPVIRISSVTSGFANIAPPRPYLEGWLATGLEAGEEYDVDVSVIGYKEAHQFIVVPNVSFSGMNAATNVFVYIKPLNDDKSDSLTLDASVLAPKAEKDVQHAIKDLRSDKLSSAQKHLDKALRAAPGNSYVNYLLGMCYLRGNKLPQAKASLEKSVAADSKRAPALLALGMLRYRQSDYVGAIPLLEQAVQLDPTAWRGDWVLASSYLHQGQYEKARDAAQKALQLGKEGATPVQLFLGEAEASLGDRPKAIAAFQAFVHAAPNNPSAPQVRKWIELLEKPPEVAKTPAPETAAMHTGTATELPGGSTLTALSAAVPAPPVELPPKAGWAPPDIDAAMPNVVSASACSLPKILDEAGKGADQFVTDLEKFSATEQYQSVEVKRDAQLETPESSTYDYMLVLDTSQPRFPRLMEYRQLITGINPPVGSMADQSAPALALAFHPDFRNDFKWTCEGLGEWNNQPTWVVRFEQKPNIPVARLQAFDTGASSALVPLKGLAWISTSGGHVVHLETDLARPVPSVQLQLEHFAIDYVPVAFHTHKVTLWLPDNVDVYLHYQNHYLHHYHHYTNFHLFWVGESQKIGKPKESATKP